MIDLVSIMIGLGGFLVVGGIVLLHGIYCAFLWFIAMSRVQNGTFDPYCPRCGHFLNLAKYKDHSISKSYDRGVCPLCGAKLRTMGC